MSDLLRMEIFDCIAPVARPVHDFGDEFTSDEATATIGLRAGFAPGRGFHCRGRFGVLGEAPAAVAAAPPPWQSRFAASGGP